MVGSQGNTLTNRERDVLIYVARGFTNKEIAGQLCTSTSAVKVFLHQAYVKMGARNRAQAVVQAIKSGSIGPQEIFSQDELVELLTALGPESIKLIADLVKQRQEALAQLIGSLGPNAVHALNQLIQGKMNQSPEQNNSQ